MLGKFNLGALMKGAEKIQKMVEKNQEELANTEVIGEAGAGLVKAVMSGLYILKDLQVADEVKKESDEVQKDLIIAAVNNATQKIANLTQNKMTDMSQLFTGFGAQDE
jgi:nucleoid-associated protein EbfC